MRRAVPMLLLTLAAAAALAGCGSSDPATTTTAAGGAAGASTEPTAVPDLAGRTFVSKTVTGHRLAPDTAVTLAFEDGTLSASAGCNSLRASYAVVAGRLRLEGEPASTMMGCEPSHMRQDEWLAAFLGEGPKVSGVGEQVTLRAGGVAIELAEERPKTPPPVVGTTWTLDSLAEAQGSVASVPAGVEPPTLKLAADGTAELFAGCNRGTVPARVDGAFIVFGQAALTRKACGADADELERTVVSILHGKTAFGFEGPRMSIANRGRHLIFRGP